MTNITIDHCPQTHQLQILFGKIYQVLQLDNLLNMAKLKHVHISNGQSIKAALSLLQCNGVSLNKNKSQDQYG